MALFNGGRMAALFLFVKRRTMGARFIAVVLFLAMVSLPVMAAVEEATWGEIKANQQELVRPAAKIAHHEASEELQVDDVGFAELLIGPWESRRYNDDDQLEVVQYVFEEGGRVTLYQTLVESDEAVEPLVGRWRLEPDRITIVWDLDWQGTAESRWVDVVLYVHEEENLLVLDYNDAADKELRTLNQDTRPPPGLVRNWLVEPSEGTISVDHARWVIQDFKVFAADGHLPSHLQVEVVEETRPTPRPKALHVLKKQAYYGMEEVPQVNLCGPGSGLRWDSDRDSDRVLNIPIPPSGESGFFVTRCGTARGTINIYAPEANPGVDDPLATYRVR